MLLCTLFISQSCKEEIYSHLLSCGKTWACVCMCAILLNTMTLPGELCDNLSCSVYHLSELLWGFTHVVNLAFSDISVWMRNFWKTPMWTESVLKRKLSFQIYPDQTNKLALNFLQRSMESSRANTRDSQCLLILH